MEEHRLHKRCVMLFRASAELVCQDTPGWLGFLLDQCTTDPGKATHSAGESRYFGKVSERFSC